MCEGHEQVDDFDLWNVSLTRIRRNDAKLDAGRNHVGQGLLPSRHKMVIIARPIGFEHKAGPGLT